ncbi:beta-N-acetylhexosaminidase [Opitutaceae bacterium TAV5]|nr:beta-N-acetylhexosaminidase [Opitutaceae bacterium TAV5]
MTTIPLPVSSESREGSYALPSAHADIPTADIHCRLMSAASDDLASDEAYTLEITPDAPATRGRITLAASTERGLFYARQTLRQLVANARAANATALPALFIGDQPRFAWRGVHVDVARYMKTADELKRFLDLMALLKFNVFHWHLTDDQGWRIEIKKYPRLTEVGAWRAESPLLHDRTQGDGKRYGGFYTQDQIREIVAYAAERHITVVPEIDMPGHASAAIAAYPEFGNQDAPDFNPAVQTRWIIHRYTFAPTEAVFRFLENVLDEILDLFPSPCIHIGGDEVPKDQWLASPTARRVMSAHGLADGDALQSWFVRRIETFLRSRGRQLVGWDDIHEGGLSPTAVVMSWRDDTAWMQVAFEQGNPVVMTPSSHCYFDYAQGDHATEPPAMGSHITTLEKVYGYEPVPAGLDPSRHNLVLGVQACLWSELVPEYSDLEYMAFPRLCALAEVAWTTPGRKNPASFRNRLRTLLASDLFQGVNYRPLSPDPTDE